MTSKNQISRAGQWWVLAAGFFGWMFAGVQLGITSLVMRAAAKDLLSTTDEGEIGQWFGWLVSSFLLGGAVGGYLFGWIGDRIGRKRAMAASIACYSLLAGLTYLVDSPRALLICRFATGLGVGGMWPNGVALIAEAWPKMSRPMLAGAIGTAANIGIVIASIITCYVHVTPEDWRWTMLASTAPILLAVLVFAFVPESPKWLAVRDQRHANPMLDGPSPLVEIFQRPLLRVTVVGIVLGTVPLFGGWGAANWANAWAGQVGEQKISATGEPSAAVTDPALKARVLLSRSAPGSLASLLGGLVAAALGRRRSYFLLSALCLFCAQYLFWYSHPSRPNFLWWNGALGLFSGFFFGWLPYCLPELFPTRVRSTGAGVSFNFGRIATVIGILVAAGLLKEIFAGDYARIGRLTSWIYAVGLVIAFMIPAPTDPD